MKRIEGRVTSSSSSWQPSWPPVGAGSSTFLGAALASSISFLAVARSDSAAASFALVAASSAVMEA